MTAPNAVEHLRGLESHLRSKIRGQDHLLPRLAALFCRAGLNLASAELPRGSVLLIGPTGTGKSESFACACDYVFGVDHLITIDLSEYQDHSGITKLLGEDRKDPGLLGCALNTASGGGLLFDEIEKAHPTVLDLFLQMLWRGCITDATGTVHRLSDYVIGFTSNLGAADTMRMEYASMASASQAILRRVGEGLRPELLGRIDEKLVFSRLTSDVQREICALEVAREVDRLGNLGYDLEITKEALELLVREGFHSSLGARPLRKVVERNLQDVVVRTMFAKGCVAGKVLPDWANHRLVLGAICAEI